MIPWTWLGNREKRIFFMRKTGSVKLRYRSQKNLPVRARDLTVVCHTLTAFVRGLLEWTHVLTDCERGCGCCPVYCIAPYADASNLKASQSIPELAFCMTIKSCFGGIRSYYIGQHYVVFEVFCLLGRKTWAHIFLIHVKISCFPADIDIFQCFD